MGVAGGGLLLQLACVLLVRTGLSGVLMGVLLRLGVLWVVLLRLRVLMLTRATPPHSASPWRWSPGPQRSDARHTDNTPASVATSTSLASHGTSVAWRRRGPDTTSHHWPHSYAWRLGSRCWLPGSSNRWPHQPWPCLNIGRLLWNIV